MVLGLQRSCKDSTEFPYALHPVSPIINILQYCICHNWWANIDTLLLTKVHTCSAILKLTTMSWCRLQRLRAQSSLRLFSFQIPANSGVPRLSVFLTNWLQFSNLLEWFTELREVLYLWLQFYYKGYKSGRKYSVSTLTSLLQLNSGTNHSELVQTLQVKRHCLQIITEKLR